MADEGGIISGFQQRRHLEEALAGLASTASEAALVQAIRDIANSYPADMLLAAVVRHLGTPDSQLRGGLGHLSALLSPEETVSTLRGVVANRQKTAQERTTAALFLDRYLGEPAPSSLLADLAGSDDVPFQSLLEAVKEGRRNRHVLLEYVVQMQQHSVEVAFMVLGLIDRVDAPDRVELLRLIAQDTRMQVARGAIDRLVQLAASDGQNGALRALHTLRFVLPPKQAAIVDHDVRKLQFRGRRYQLPPPDRWRALINAADVGAYFSVWLVRGPEAGRPDSGALLGFVLNLSEGIVQFSGTETMEQVYLPATQPVGSLVPIHNGGVQSMLLETEFVVGCWLVKATLAGHWQRTNPAPLPDEFKLYNDLIAQFELPRLPPELEALWSQPEPVAGQPPDLAALARAAEALIGHPALASWVQWSATLWTTVRPLTKAQLDLPRPALVGLLLREVGDLPKSEQLLATMAQGLHLLALWFGIAGENQNAQRAMQLSYCMKRLPVMQNPLLAVLLEAGLQT